VDFELDPHGRLLRPSIHDGYLLGIELPRESVARLTIRNLAKQLIHIELEGLERLRCDGFTEGNIVLDLIVTTGRVPDDWALRQLLGNLHPSVQEPHVSNHEKWIASIRASIITGDKSFIELTSSYGAQIFALCSAINHTKPDYA
jgi:hypothetical protein